MEKFGGNVVKQLVDTMSLNAMALRLTIYQAAHFYRGGGPRDDRYMKRVFPDHARPLYEAYLTKQRQVQRAKQKARERALKERRQLAKARGEVLVATKPPPIVIKAKSATIPVYSRGKGNG